MGLIKPISTRTNSIFNNTCQEEARYFIPDVIFVMSFLVYIIKRYRYFQSSRINILLIQVTR